MTEFVAEESVLREMLAMAQRKINSAQVSLQSGFCDDASSRAYYGAYHAVCAALASKALSFSSHGRTLGAFNKEFIQNGPLPDDSFKKLQTLFTNRQTGDYDVSATISKEMAAQDIENANGF